MQGGIGSIDSLSQLIEDVTTQARVTMIQAATILTPVNSKLTEGKTEFTRDNIQSIHTSQLYNLRKYTLTK